MSEETIKKILLDIEQKENIKILFAIENGSRAWDMASANSDFDIRFVYYRDYKDYLKLSKTKDVINCAFTKDIIPCDAQGSLYDFSGFDIFKYFDLLKNSNPTAIEWLNSHICYLGNNDIPLKEYINKNFSQVRLFHHYFSLFKRMGNRYVFDKDKTTYKKYLYSLRGLINAKYVYLLNKVPPLSFKNAVYELKDEIPEIVFNKINEVIEIKKSGKERDEIDSIPVFDEYILEEINKKYENFDNHFPSEDILNKEIEKILF